MERPAKSPAGREGECFPRLPAQPAISRCPPTVHLWCVPCRSPPAGPVLERVSSNSKSSHVLHSASSSACPVCTTCCYSYVFFFFFFFFFVDKCVKKKILVDYGYRPYSSVALHLAVLRFPPHIPHKQGLRLYWGQEN